MNCDLCFLSETDGTFVKIKLTYRLTKQQQQQPKYTQQPRNLITQIRLQNIRSNN